MLVPDLAVAFAVSLILVTLAYGRGSLSASGSLAALLIGTLILGLGGWNWGLLLGLFFVSSSALSHFRESEKRRLAEKFDKGHRRDWGQVLANGGLGATAAVASAWLPAEGWFLFFIGAMATVTADTWATELGTLSRKPPYLITSGRQVETGTSGGVSLLGTLVSLAGGFTIGLIAGLVSDDLGLLLAALIGTVGGQTGSLLDSVLGATVQQLYYCEVCQKETERRRHRCGHPTRPLRGWFWLNNDLVNLLSSAAGGLVAVGLWIAMA